MRTIIKILIAPIIWFGALVAVITDAFRIGYYDIGTRLVDWIRD